MKIEYVHGLSDDEAYGRISDLLQELQEQYSGRISDSQTLWNPSYTQMDFRMRIMGFPTDGRVYLNDGRVILEGNIPPALELFSGTIERIIKEKLEDILS